MLNQCILTGNLGDDPLAYYTPNSMTALEIRPATLYLLYIKDRRDQASGRKLSNQIPTAQNEETYFPDFLKFLATTFFI
jgi:hypothetical protein